MKRIIIFFATLAIALNAHAQTDSLVTVDTKGDGLNFNIAGFSVKLEGKDQQKKKTYKPYSTSTLGVKWGVTRLTDSPYYGDWAGLGNFLNLSGKSNSLSIEPISCHLRLDRKGIVWINTGICCTWENYHFFNPITLVNNDNGNLMPVQIEEKIKRTQMNTFYLGASLGLAFRIGNVKIGANATPEVLCYSESRYKTTDKVKHKTEIQGLNPVRLKVGATMMLDWIGVYVDYGLNPMFKEGTGNDARMVSIGVKIGI